MKTLEELRVQVEYYVGDLEQKQSERYTKFNSGNFPFFTVAEISLDYQIVTAQTILMWIRELEKNNEKK